MRLVYCFVLVVLAVALLLHGGGNMPSIKKMAQADAKRVPPAWLQPLLETRYFDECPDHPLGENRGPRRGGTCNFFCTTCPGRALCAACMVDHPIHKAIQIRKLSGHSVVKVAEVDALQLEVSDVQPYLLNGHHVVFLNNRPMAGQGRAGEVRCEECERALLSTAYRFCSIGCKLEALPEDLDFTVTFTVPPKSDDESRESDSGSSSDGGNPARNSAKEGEAGSSATSKLQTTEAVEGVPKIF